MASSQCKVLIVGAGIGGLTLAILLERAKIPYIVFEKSSTFRPLGSAINLSPIVFHLLSQLGIYEEIEAISKPFRNLHIQTLDLETDKHTFRGSLDPKLDLVDLFGFEALIMSRPDLFDILLRQVPKEKIKMGKRIVQASQNINGVTIKDEDDNLFFGDLLVGADGCYSLVREEMLRGLEKKGKLSKADAAPLEHGIECVVGVTKPLDPKKYAAVHDEFSEFQVILVKQMPMTIWCMPLSEGRLGWMVSESKSKHKKRPSSPSPSSPSISSPMVPSVPTFSSVPPTFSSTPLFSPTPSASCASSPTLLSSPSSTSSLSSLSDLEAVQDKNSKYSEWGPQAARDIYGKLEKHATPYGTLFQEIIDNTPLELISKVVLEEKYLDTWQDGRICLLGDACHKSLPFGAQGSQQAMLDALMLANLLYDMPTHYNADICHVLKQYHENRKHISKAACEGSSMTSKLFHTKGWVGDTARNMIFHHIPDWIVLKGSLKMYRNRPQCIFLPFIKNVGRAPRLHQEYSPRYLRERAAEVAATSLAAKEAKELEKIEKSRQTEARYLETMKNTTTGGPCALMDSSSASAGFLGTDRIRTRKERRERSPPPIATGTAVPVPKPTTPTPMITTTTTTTTTPGTTSSKYTTHLAALSRSRSNDSIRSTPGIFLNSSNRALAL